MDEALKDILKVLGPNASAVIIVWMGIRYMMWREKRHIEIADRCHDIMERGIRVEAQCDSTLKEVKNLLEDK